MELSKETYTTSPVKQSDVKSVIKSIMEDEKIVSSNVQKKLDVESQEKPPEKKRRGRPPKKKENEQENESDKKPEKKKRQPKKKDTDKDTETDTDTQTTVVPVKKSRGRPKKQPTTTQPTQPSHNNLSHDYDDMIPLIQSISSQHPIQNIPDTTLKYIIFLIHLFHHTPTPPPTPTTLTHLILHTLQHFHPHHLHTSSPFIKHTLFNTYQNYSSTISHKG